MAPTARQPYKTGGEGCVASRLLGQRGAASASGWSPTAGAGLERSRGSEDRPGLLGAEAETDLKTWYVLITSGLHSL